MCFPVGFHGSFKGLDKALLATWVAKGAAVFFVGEGRCGEDLLYGAYVVGLKGGEVSFEVGQRCVKLSVTFVVNVALLTKNPRLRKPRFPETLWLISRRRLPAMVEVFGNLAAWLNSAR